MKLGIRFLAVIAGIVCSAAAAVPEFSVDEQGTLHVTVNGKTVLTDTAPAMADARWNRVAGFAPAPETRWAETGRVICSWGGGGSMMTRSVEQQNGKVRIVWLMRFLNGVEAARHVELGCSLPGARPARTGMRANTVTVEAAGEAVEISFTGFSIPWVFEKQQESGIQLILAWNYDPAAINRIEFAMLIGTAPGKATEEK